MSVSAVSGHTAITPRPTPAGANRPSPGLSEQDQLAVVAARPAALHGAALAAAGLTSSDPTDPTATGSAAGQGSVDTYL